MCPVLTMVGVEKPAPPFFPMPPKKYPINPDKSSNMISNKRLLYVLFLVTLSLATSGQTTQIFPQNNRVFAQGTLIRRDTMSRKESVEYQRALFWIKKGRHDSAQKICLVILRTNPRQTNTELLLGRIYSWDRKYDSARFYVKDVLSVEPDNEEALEAIINIELWSGQLDQAIKYCEEALARYPDSEKLLIEKAKVYDRQGRYKEAYQIVQQLKKLNSANKEAIEFDQYLKRKIERTPEKNVVGLNYHYDHFNRILTPWSYASMYFMHRTEAGNISAAMNYANRFQSQGLQYEVNLYPRISSSMKASLGAAYSKDSIFPSLDLSAGLSHTLLKKAELEVGARYLSFSRQINPTFIFTGALNISLHRFWISGRIFISPQQTQPSQSYYLTTRYYGKNPHNNLSLLLGSGSYLYDYYDLGSGKTINYSTESKRIRLSYQCNVFSSKNILKVYLGYEKRTYNSGLALDRITTGLGIERWF